MVRRRAVEGVAREARPPGKPRQRRDLAVGRDPAAWNAAHHGADAREGVPGRRAIMGRFTA
jgi:hypothetical protein